MDPNLSRSLNADALRLISTCEIQAFRSIVNAIIASDNKPSIRISALHGRLKDAGAGDELASALASQLIAIAILRRINDASYEDFIDAVIGTMSMNGLDQDSISWFESAKAEFVSLLKLESTRLISKALHLSTQTDNLLRRGKIISDIRPVFDGDRTSVVGAIVIQSLRIKFIGKSDFGSDSEMTFSVDIDDLRKLKDEIEKAIAKSDAAKAFLQNSLKENFFVVGEETYSYE